MPMYHWTVPDKDSPYAGWHAVVIAPDVEAARTIAFYQFRDDFGEQGAFHLDHEPDQEIETEGAIVIRSGKE